MKETWANKNQFDIVKEFTKIVVCGRQRRRTPISGFLVVWSPGAKGSQSSNHADLGVPSEGETVEMCI